ncbi:hypothetical protein N656DRAFT_738370, partial [Canariomyces notabilis]
SWRPTLIIIQIPENLVVGCRISIFHSHLCESVLPDNFQLTAYHHSPSSGPLRENLDGWVLKTLLVCSSHLLSEGRNSWHRIFGRGLNSGLKTEKEIASDANFNAAKELISESRVEKCQTIIVSIWSIGLNSLRLGRGKTQIELEHDFKYEYLVEPLIDRISLPSGFLFRRVTITQT